MNVIRLSTGRALEASRAPPRQLRWCQRRKRSDMAICRGRSQGAAGDIQARDYCMTVPYSCGAARYMDAISWSGHHAVVDNSIFVEP
jgi:hypothetical protein